MSEQLCAVAIMAKASIAGTVKTRLVPPLTHQEAAEALGVSHGTYYAILNGKPVSELTNAKVKNRLAEKAA